MSVPHEDRPGARRPADAGTSSNTPDAAAKIQAPIHSGPVRISVIIPAFNARRVIGRCLRSVTRQKIHVAYEVLVVASSRDGTVERIRREFPGVRVVRLDARAHPGTARNVGVRHARGQILAFTDADCVPDPDWLACLVDYHGSTPGESDGRPVALAGSIANGLPRSTVATADWFLEFSNVLPGRLPETCAFGPTANFSLPRAVFLAAGGFDDNRTAEDMALGLELRAQGHRVRFDPAPRIRHFGRARWAPFLRKQFELGLGSALVRKKRPLPGAWIVRVSPLVPLLFFFRLFHVARRSLQADRRHVLRLLRCVHAFGIGLGAWVSGFLAGTLRRSPSSHWNFQVRGLMAPPAGRTVSDEIACHVPIALVEHGRGPVRRPGTRRRRSPVKRVVHRVVNRLGYRIQRVPAEKSRWEPGKTYWNADYLRRLRFEPRTLVDVGVGRGIAPLYQAFPEAHLVLVDPIRECEPVMQQVLATRPGDYVVAALGDREGSLSIYTDRVDLEKCSFRFRQPIERNEKGYGRREVPVTTLDALMDRYDLTPPFGLKIDTEGYELDVVMGAERFLARTDFVIAEVAVADRFEKGYTFAAFVAAMDARGFAVRDVLEIGRASNSEVTFLDLVFIRVRTRREIAAARPAGESALR
jgi:FkbM family methyltransferase